MEEANKEVILQKLPQLIQLTKCSEIFLTIFLSKKIFSNSDVESIKTAALNNGPSAGCSKFYNFLESRAGSFEVLLDALGQTGQNGVLQILNVSGDSQTMIKQSNLCKFTSNSLEYISDYVNQRDEYYLLVCSKDCKLTCERILECPPHCQLYSELEILEIISRKPSLEHNKIMLVNLEDNLDLLGIIGQNTQLKVVFVTRLTETELHDKLANQKTAFKIAKDFIRWGDLSPQIKYKIITGIKHCLCLTGNPLFDALENIEENLLIDLVNGKFPKPENLFHETVPQLINYYISRNLQTKYLIANSVLDDVHGNNLVLFSGIQRNALFDLCGQKQTETSSNVLKTKSLNSHFIVLETEMDFDSICRTFPSYSVHHLEYNESEFIWKRSRGNLAIMQNHVATKQRLITESEFVSNILCQSNKNLICISDTPGKGKSILLANLATEVKKHFDNGIVGFILISDLVERLKENCKTTLTSSETFSGVSSFLSTSSLGHAYLSANKLHLLDLMLDGFDEVKSSDVKFALEVVKNIRSVFSDTRIWITCRPHMLAELERCLETLGYNIAPFRKTEQISFLSSFWANNIERCDQKALSCFAEQCLKTIDSSLGNTKEDIAGIPLQCLLIAEVYERDAKRFVSSKSTYGMPLYQEIATVEDLYKKLNEKKMEKFRLRYNTNKLSKSDVFSAHMQMAMQVIYPSHVSQLFETPYNSMSLNEIYDFGLVEATNSSSPKFLHRTFAEYFVALFVSESLNKHPTEKIYEFLFDQILITDQDSALVLERDPCGSSNSQEIYLSFSKFTQNVICHFLNSFLEKENVFLTKNLAMINRFSIYSIAEACVYHNLANLFHYFVLKHDNITVVMNGDFLSKTVYWAEVPLLEIIMREYVTLNETPHVRLKYSLLSGIGNCSKYRYKYYISDNYGSTYMNDGKTCITLLHLAMRKADYATVEFLIAKYYQVSVVENENQVYNNLVSFLLKNSNGDNDRVIADKKQIVSCLAKINKDLLTVESEYGQFPIEIRQTHCELIDTLWKLTTKFYKKRNVIIQVLQSFTRELSCKTFFQFLKTAFLSLEKRTIEEIFSIGSLLEDIFLIDELNTDVLDFIKYHCSCLSDINSDIRIKCFVNATRRQNEVILNWLLNNLSYTSENIKSILTELGFFTLGNGVDILLLHLKQHLLFEKFPNCCETFQFLFKNKQSDPTNIAMTLSLISYFVYRDHQQDYMEGSLETVLTNLIEIGISYCDQLIHEFLVSNQYGVVLKLVWIAYVSGTSDQRVISNLNLYLKDADMQLKDSFGNTLIHIVAQYFKLTWDRICFNSFLVKAELYCDISLDERILFLSFSGLSIWKVLVKSQINILHCNIDHVTPICLLSKNGCNDTKPISDAIIFATAAMLDKRIWSDKEIHQMFYLVIKSHCIEVVKAIYEMYVKMCDILSVLAANVTVEFNGKEYNFLDAALENGRDDVLEFVQNSIKVNTPLMPPSANCIHRCISSNAFNAEFYGLKFIYYVAKTFPSKMHELVNHKNDKNLVPLSFPEISRYHVYHLCYYGADLNAVDDNKNTPLHLALTQRSWRSINMQVINQLIDKGSNVNAQNSKMETPLSILVQKPDHGEPFFSYNSVKMNCFENLLRHKADLTIKDEIGNTIMHHFVEKVVSGKVFHRIVQILIANDFTKVLIMQNMYGQTPLQLANDYLNINEDTKRILREHGILDYLTQN